MTEDRYITFSVSSNASDNKNDLEYNWFVNNVPPPSTGSTFTYRPEEPGQYTISVEVTNECTPVSGGEALTAEAILNVKADPDNYAPDMSGNFKLTGKDCFDVAQSNFTGTCGTQVQRPGDFLDGSRNWAEGREWTYTFTVIGSESYNNLQFVIDDPSVLIKSETSAPLGNTHTLVFDESVLTKALGKNRASALDITVYALYEVNSVKKRVSLDIKVQDCLCGCGAYIARDVWKIFMCHNLGADETYDPFIPAAKIHGAKYKYGTKNATLTMKQDQESAAAVTGWTNTTIYPYQLKNDWDMINNNPCPDGYRVPTVAEWDGVINKSNNPQTSIGTWTIGSNNYACGVKFGDMLFLPATGTLFHATGDLSNRAYGYYWASNRRLSSDGQKVYRLTFHSTSNPAVNYIDKREAGYSVRCIIAE
jgi:uncharacterized protein (TIGR02145 family)